MSRRYREAVLGCLWVLAAANAAANTAGTTGAQFLEIPIGARAIAMGGAQGASFDDATALDYNPAGLAQLSGGSAVMMHSEYLQDFSHDSLSVARNFDEQGVFALGLKRLSLGSVERVDNTGTPTGELSSPGALAATAGCALNFGRLALGAAGKYISSRIDATASTVALDAGAALRAESLLLAVSAANLGPGLKFARTLDPLPATLRLGAALDLRAWSLAADLVAPRGAAPYAAGGVEYHLAAPGAAVLSGRIGYNGRAAAGRLDGLAGLSAGIGFRLNQLHFDYAFVPAGALGNTHRLSVGWSWGGLSG